MGSALKAYIDASGDTPEDFAARAALGAGRFESVLRGEAAPTPAEARRIVDASGGAIDFEALYAPFGGAPVIALDDASYTDDYPNVPGLAASLRCALDENPAGGVRLTNETLMAVAEAAANTHAALAGVTSRRGADRLVQALRAVLEEILKEFPAAASDPHSLRPEATASRAASLYYRDFPQT